MPGMERYSYRAEDESRNQEPFFRSDVENRPEAPSYEPIRPEGGLWRMAKRLLAPLVALGFLFAKFKGLLFLLLKVKFVGTGLSMLVSAGAWALVYPVWFAVGLVVLIWVHEMGHVLQLRREGIRASAPMFIPFLGAYIGMKEMPKNALAEARVGLAGPVLGLLGGLATVGLYALTQNPLFLGLAFFNFLLNLVNLIPVLPLDGGRAVGVLSPVVWIFGFVLMAALSILVPFMLFVVLFAVLLGGPELWRRWKARNTPEGQAYHKIETRHRVMVGAVYVGLIVALTLLMAATSTPGPTGALAVA
jgi:Zn-dependent protease